ncbi:MAG: DUF3501 family protein, partial [Dongiaceae bacterium]
LGGVEHTVVLRVDGETIAGAAEADQDRSTAEGKASSVQFIRFAFSPAQIGRFRRPGSEVVVGFTHPAHGHLTIMPDDVRAALAEDFDD